MRLSVPICFRNPAVTLGTLRILVFIPSYYTQRSASYHSSLTKTMSATPAFVMGVLCIVGGLTGFARTRSVPSLVAGVGVGALYLYSGNAIQSNAPNGLHYALGASAILLLSSLPRVGKGPVPKVLALTSTVAGLYYGNSVYQLTK